MLLSGNMWPAGCVFKTLALVHALMPWKSKIYRRSCPTPPRRLVFCLHAGYSNQMKRRNGMDFFSLLSITKGHVSNHLYLIPLTKDEKKSRSVKG
jgi:hypothetical protein